MADDPQHNGGGAGAAEDDTKLDVEALGNKNEELRKLDELATD